MCVGSTLKRAFGRALERAGVGLGVRWGGQAGGLACIGACVGVFVGACDVHALGRVLVRAFVRVLGWASVGVQLVPALVRASGCVMLPTLERAIDVRWEVSWCVR